MSSQHPTELVHFRWPYGCKHLSMIAGSWAEWKPQVMFPSKESPEDAMEVWTADFMLPTDTIYKYKFIIDGDWHHDGNLPAKKNKEGMWENVIKLGDYESEPETEEEVEEEEEAAKEEEGGKKEEVKEKEKPTESKQSIENSNNHSQGIEI